MWVMPSIFVASALVLGTLLPAVEPADGTALEGVVFGGTASGARDILAVVAGAMITVIGLAFSLTIIALQMAASQFSPRVLRGFLEDRGNQLVLSLLLATFAYSVAVIRVIRDEDAPDGEFLPRLAVTVGIVLTLLAVMALVYFIHHLTQVLRPDTIMSGIVGEALSAIGKVHPDAVEAEGDHAPLPRPGTEPYPVPAQRSGYLQAVKLDGVVRAAARLDAIVRLRPAIGTQVSEGTTIAWIWPRDGASWPEWESMQADERDEAMKAWRRAVHDHVHLGRERTMQQDVAFGLRQLADIASKALSPGVNDPTTAVDALGHMARITCCLAGRKLGGGTHADEDGEVRTLVPSPSFADYLALACDQPRRYGAGDPQVMIAVLGLLADVGELVASDEYAAVVSRECARTLEVAREQLDATDMVRVEAAADRVRSAVEHRARPYPEVGR